MINQIKISGIAVSEGVSRNKRRYLGVELEKFTPTLNGRPILKDHEGVTDNVIGKITESIYDSKTKSVKYSGWIKEDGTGIIEKIKDGRISEVSIGAIAGKVVKENKDDEIIIPIDLEALELSTTPVPGNKGTSISFESKKYSNEDLNEMINKYKKEQISQSYDNSYKIEKEDKSMEKTTDKTDSVTEESKMDEMKKELEILKASNEALSKEKAELLEAQRQEALKKYEELCESKKISTQDLSKATMEMIQFGINTVKSLPEAVEDEEVEDEDTSEDESEDEAEEKVSIKKPIAESKSKTLKLDTKVSEEFDNYVITTEDVSGHGVALYKNY